MASLFPRWSNSVYWAAIAGGFGALVCTPIALVAWARTPYATGRGEPVSQPIKFDHRHHNRDDGIDCVFCHSGAIRGKTAGVPSSAQCMGCHSQIWTDSPELAVLRKSTFEGTPLRWNRVTRMPDFVFFDHSAHTSHGVGCVSCHGRVDQMGQVFASEPLTMRWCLDCHRAPEKHLRPRSKITEMEYQPDRPQEELGRVLRAEYGVRSLTDCTVCHR